jgi:hypothetical protein
MRIYLRRRFFAAVSLTTLIIVACVISSTNRPNPLDVSGAERFVQSPIKAHLGDGSTVLFRRGATVGNLQIVGDGVRFSATLDSSPVGRIALDSIIGVEAFERDVNPGRTLIYAPISGFVSTVAVAVLAVAIFGSCPTIYADSAGVPSLQAESFSYSIAPLLAKRDVDLLNVKPDANGVIRLEVRNEALETHYIEQIELLETRHRVDEIVAPVARGGFVALSRVATPASIVDSRGRNVREELSVADGRVFSSGDSALVAAADGSGSSEEHIDITVPRDAGRDSLALLLDMRSSLLSTTIFYDEMLARHGARALDWVGHDLSKITTVAQVARWYTDHFGLRVSVRDGDDWKPIVRMMDFGPTAWRTVAAVIPHARRLRGDSIRLRLSFVTDEFRIDRVAATWDVRPVEARRISAARVTESGGMRRDDVRDFIRAADDRHVVTSPGDRFAVDFDVGRDATPRTFLVAVDGYYVEWVRPAWIRAATDSLPFSPRTTTQEVLRAWVASRESLEHRFFRDRVPVQ